MYKIQEDTDRGAGHASINSYSESEGKLYLHLVAFEGIVHMPELHV